MRPNREERREYQKDASDALRKAGLMAWMANRDLVIGLEARNRMKGLEQDAERRGKLICTAETIRRAFKKMEEGLEKLRENSIKEAQENAKQAYTLWSEAQHTQNELISQTTGNEFRDTVACLRRCECGIENVGRAIELLGKC